MVECYLVQTAERHWSGWVLGVKTKSHLTSYSDDFFHRKVRMQHTPCIPARQENSR